MPDKIRFCVLGDPQGQPRTRVRPGGGRPYNARGRIDDWKAAIALALNPLLPPEPFSGPIGLQLTFRFARPKSHFGTGKNADKLKASAPSDYTAKPELDNLEKAVLDCFTRLRLWKDDAQVVNLATCKVYAAEGYRPGMEVVVWRMNGRIK